MDQSLLPNIYDFISHTYPFSQLDTLAKDAVATAVKISYHSPDDVLDNEQLTGAGLYMVRVGAAEEINKSDNSLRARLGVGDSFGYSQINKQGESDYKITFLENTLLYFISKQMLQFLINKNKTVGEYFNSKEWVRLSSTHKNNEESNTIPSFTERTVSSVCSTDVVIINEETTIQNTALQISQMHTDVALISNDNSTLQGIVTKSDITARAVATGLDIKRPIRDIMSRTVLTVDGKRPIYDALELMVMHNIKCLPVLDGNKIIGTVTTRQLLTHSQLQAVYLNKDIQNAPDLEKLIKISKHKKEVFETLVETGVEPRIVQKVMSHFCDLYCQRILQLAEENFGKAPCAYAFAAAGSLARNEVQFLSDQDNCIITERDLTETERKYFADLSDFVCKSLDKCGYPLCDGHFMACNPKWCQGYSTWTHYYDSWISNTNEDAILNSSVFLDMRCLYGDEFLVTKLRQHLIKAVASNSRFLATLMKISANVTPPIGTFRQFVLTKDGKNNPSLNIKKQAINLIVEIARLYGLSAGTLKCDTYLRLEDAVKHDLIKEDEFRELYEAYTFLNKVRFEHQLQSLKSGSPMSNHLEPSVLSQFERNHLRDAFRIIARHQQAALFRFTGGIGILG